MSDNALTPVSFKRGVAHEPRLSEPYVPGRRSKRFWTKEQDDVIRVYYPKGGVAACAARLPQHLTSKGTIYCRASELGVKSKRRGQRTSHDYGPEMDARIREAWPTLDSKKRGAVNELADELGVPRWWLSKRALKLGLDKIVHRKEPKWTKAEEHLLANLPLHDPEKSAEIMREYGYRRSPIAIKVKAARLSISRRSTWRTLSSRGAARILGVDDKWISGRIIAGDLPARKANDNLLAQQGGSRWEIEREDLRRFVVDHLEQVDLRKVDKVPFIDLVIGGIDQFLADGGDSTGQQEGRLNPEQPQHLTNPTERPAVNSSGGQATTTGRSRRHRRRRGQWRRENTYRRRKDRAS